MNSIVKQLRSQAFEILKDVPTSGLANLLEFAALSIESKSSHIDTLTAENARLTAAHEMQGESLVVLPRWMASNMEDKMKEQAEEIRTMKEAIEDVKYYVSNPSAWEHYDDGVSEKIRAILKAAGMA